MGNIKIPKKLNPDLLQDSIVEVRYDLSIDYEIAIGKIHEVLTSLGYNYMSPYIKPEANQRDFAINFTVLQPIFFKKDIRIKLTPDSFVFNCNFADGSGYIGWNSYFPQIKTAIEKITKLNIIDKFTRIGLRYINSLYNVNIYEKLIQDVRIKIPEIKTNSTTFLTQINSGDFNINLKVQNNLEVKGKTDKVSLIDIDVFRNIEKEMKITDLIKTIDLAHTKEMDLLIRILDPEYVKTLKPEY